MGLGIGLVWLATAAAVLHPRFAAEGGPYLDRLGLPRALMGLTCAGEAALGLWVVLRPPDRATTLLQVGAIVFFTAVLAGLEPALLVHPFGVLSKNLPLLALLLVRQRVAEAGWTPGAVGLLRAGMAAIWLTEGLFPKILFPTAYERAVVARSGLVPLDPGTFLFFMGLAQVASGLVLLCARGRLERLVLGAQAVALVLLPVLVSWPEPSLWAHPFGPLTKNAPILAGTVILLCRPWAR